jgi:hypothetical protein
MVGTGYSSNSEESQITRNTVRTEPGMNFLPYTEPPSFPVLDISSLLNSPLMIIIIARDDALITFLPDNSFQYSLKSHFNGLISR